MLFRSVYKNGTVYTGNGFVTDFAVENGKFCFVGETDKATADEVVDLNGKFVESDQQSNRTGTPYREIPRKT